MSISAIINSIQPSVANQTIQGSAVGDDSSPLANAYVMLVKPTNQSNNNFVLQPIKIATTDSQGNFQFDNLPPGEYQTIVEQTPAAAAPAAYIDPNAVSPQLSDNYIVLNEDLNSEIKPKIRNNHIGSLVGVSYFVNSIWYGEPTITIGGNCTVPAVIRVVMEPIPPVFYQVPDPENSLISIDGPDEVPWLAGRSAVKQVVIENPGQGYSVYGTDGNLGTDGSIYIELLGLRRHSVAVDLDLEQDAELWASVNNPVLNRRWAAPEGETGGNESDSNWFNTQTLGRDKNVLNVLAGVAPVLATEPGDFNRWVSIYASDYRMFSFATPWARNLLVRGVQYLPNSQQTYVVYPAPLIRPYTLQTPGTGIANVDIAQNNSSTLPNLEQNYGLAQFINGLQQAFAQGISAAVVGTVGEVTGTVDGAPLYFDMIYGNNSVQSALRAGEFGDPNSAEARAIVNDLKGYLGKEFLVRPVFISGHVQNVLSAAQTFNTNTRVQSGLSGLISESIVLFAAAVANSLYQGAQAIDNAVSGVSPNLYNSISREWRGLKQQSWGAAQVNPPSWLVNKSFQSSLSTGQTVTYAFNPGGYTRTVSP